MVLLFDLYRVSLHLLRNGWLVIFYFHPLVFCVLCLDFFRILFILSRNFDVEMSVELDFPP